MMVWLNLVAAPTLDSSEPIYRRVGHVATPTTQMMFLSLANTSIRARSVCWSEIKARDSNNHHTVLTLADWWIILFATIESLFWPLHSSMLTIEPRLSSTPVAHSQLQHSLLMRLIAGVVVVGTAQIGSQLQRS